MLELSVCQLQRGRVSTKDMRAHVHHTDGGKFFLVLKDEVNEVSVAMKDIDDVRALFGLLVEAIDDARREGNETCPSR